MAIGVNLVQPVGQHAYCRITVCQCLTMRMYIHAVRQSTDNQHLRTQLVQVSDKATYQVLSVGRHLPRTYDADYLGLVQVSITFII